MIEKNFIGYRPTWAEVNLRNLDHNFLQIKRLLQQDVKIMVTVKADAYGHGLVAVSKRLKSCGADYLGVASIDEAIKLRQANVDLPILVMGLIFKKDIPALFEYNLTTTVSTEDFAAALNKSAKEFGKALNIHIKIDTGMGRIGVLYKDAFRIVRKICRMKFINVEGIFTHFAFSDVSAVRNNSTAPIDACLLNAVSKGVKKDFTLHQISQFNSLITILREEGIYIPLVHAANSAGIINFKSGHFNMVRPGLSIYGLYATQNLDINLKPLLSLKSRIIYIKRVPKGYGISYGHTYVTRKNTTIVTLPIGYGDGYPRNLSNLASVLIRGRRFTISGRVCMDQIMADVFDMPVKIGDEVVLIGAQGKNKITTEELAGLAGTIPYEIACGLGSRIPRVYLPSVD